MTASGIRSRSPEREQYQKAIVIVFNTGMATNERRYNFSFSYVYSYNFLLHKICENVSMGELVEE